MTGALQNAFAEAAKLPDEEQEWLAAFILEEIKAGRHWDEILATSGDLLDELIAEAIAEDDAGETELLYPDKL